jgi:hypothetical protein
MVSVLSQFKTSIPGKPLDSPDSQGEPMVMKRYNTDAAFGWHLVVI